MGDLVGGSPVALTLRFGRFGRSRLGWAAVSAALGAALLPARGMSAQEATAHRERAAPLWLSVSTTSPAAGDAFWRGYEDLLHHFEARAVGALDTALALDSSFGLARVLRAHPGYQATAQRFAPAERQREIDRGVADAAAAAEPARELALAWAAAAQGRPGDSVERLRALAARVPDDPYVALEYATALHRTTPAEGLAALEAVRGRFPAFAPAYMPLAYAYEQARRLPEAVAAAREYARRAPGQPYAHYVHARMLTASRRFAEAALALHPTLALPRSWFDPVEQIAAAEQAAGRGAAARRALAAAVGPRVAPQDRAARLRYRAVSFVYDGNIDSARVGLRRAALDAGQAGLAGDAALSWRFLALVEGVVGGGDSVATALAAAVAADSGGTTLQHRAWAAQAYALAGRPDLARPYLAALEADADPGARQTARITAALVLVAEGRAAAALDSIAALGPMSGLPMPFVAADLAYTRECDAARARTARRSWLADPAGVNLRSVPLALAWLRARAVPHAAPGQSAPFFAPPCA